MAIAVLHRGQENPTELFALDLDHRKLLWRRTIRPNSSAKGSSLILKGDTLVLWNSLDWYREQGFPKRVLSTGAKVVSAFEVQTGDFLFHRNFTGGTADNQLRLQPVNLLDVGRDQNTESQPSADSQRRAPLLFTLGNREQVKQTGIFRLDPLVSGWMSLILKDLKFT